MKNIVIIGGGASGMTAAISASRRIRETGKEKEIRVILLEHEEIPGRKLLVTGNGKCNISNRSIKASDYHSSRPDFPMQVLTNFDEKMTETFFHSLGIVYKDRDGYCYPLSGQASAVRNILHKEMEYLDVKLHLNTHVANVLSRDHSNPKGPGFDVYTDTYYCYPGDAVILACGSGAGGVSGADFTGISMARRLGNPTLPVTPSLVQLISRDACISKLSGMRQEGVVSLYKRSEDGDSSYDEFITSEEGEIQFTDYGISGIPVFQLSGTCGEYLAAGHSLYTEIDFLPEFGRGDLLTLLEARKQSLGYRKNIDFLEGMLPDKLCQVITKKCGISLKAPVSEMTQTVLEHFVKYIKSFPIQIFNTNTMHHAQVVRGGVDPLYVDSQTMESRKVPGLFLAGEMIDVDGRCGGYNLQWAWTTGFLAGKGAVNYL